MPSGNRKRSGAAVAIKSFCFVNSKPPEVAKEQCEQCAASQPQLCLPHHLDMILPRTVYVSAPEQSLHKLYGNRDVTKFGQIEAVRWAMRPFPDFSEGWITFANRTSALDALGQPGGAMTTFEQRLTAQQIWADELKPLAFPVDDRKARQNFLALSPVVIGFNSPYEDTPVSDTQGARQALFGGDSPVAERTVYITGRPDALTVAMPRFYSLFHTAVAQVRWQRCTDYAFVTFNASSVALFAIHTVTTTGSLTPEMQAWNSDDWPSLSFRLFPTSDVDALQQNHCTTPVPGADMGTTPRPAEPGYISFRSQAPRKSIPKPLTSTGNGNLAEDGELVDDGSSTVQGSAAVAASAPVRIPEPTQSDQQLASERLPLSGPSPSELDSRSTGKRKAQDDLQPGRSSKPRLEPPTFRMQTDPAPSNTMPGNGILTPASSQHNAVTGAPSNQPVHDLNAESDRLALIAAAAYQREEIIKRTLEVSASTTRSILEYHDMKWTADLAKQTEEVSLSIILRGLDEQEVEQANHLAARAEEFKQLLRDKEQGLVAAEAALQREREAFPKLRALFGKTLEKAEKTARSAAENTLEERAAWKAEEQRLLAIIGSNLVSRLVAGGLAPL